MYSATGLMALFAVLALAVNVAQPEVQPPAAGSTTLSVAADGRGEFTTIGAAVEAAKDGDTIVVSPGTYQEALLIDKDIVIRGDGPRAEIVITGSADPTMWPAVDDLMCEYGTSADAGCSIMLVNSAAAISDLTFSGDFAGVWVYGGAPLIERVTFQDVGRASYSGDAQGGESLVASDGSGLVVRDSSFSGGRDPWLRRSTSARFEANDFTNGAGVRVGDASRDAVLRRNRISGSGTIHIHAPTALLIEDNVVEGAQRIGIDIGDVMGSGVAEGTDPTVRGNRVIGSGKVGIVVGSRARPVIEGNHISGSPTGIQIGESTATVSGNEISEGVTGIVVVSRGAPTVTDNVIDVTGRGIVAGKGTSPTISGNTVCGGDMSIYISDEATPELGENQTCKGGVTG